MDQSIIRHPLANEYINLADYRLGARVVLASDDFFAEMENLLNLSEPVFIEDKFTQRGKWMDGWETRRRRGKGKNYDWCIIRLGLMGVIKGLDVNTTHFAGNAPREVSLEAAKTSGLPGKESDWFEIMKITKVRPDSHNFFDIKNNDRWTHLRLNIYPDGGIARIKVYGIGEANWDNFVDDELIDLAAAENGGCSVGCSDMFFSSKDNLIMPGRGINMGDGWETKRRRGHEKDKGYDWNMVKLAKAGNVKKVVIDTAHFKGNFPDSFSLEACLIKERLPSGKTKWKEIIRQTPLMADTRHIFIKEIWDTKTKFSHVRLNIYPDGGVSRMNIYGAV